MGSGSTGRDQGPSDGGRGRGAGSGSDGWGQGARDGVRVRRTGSGTEGRGQDRGTGTGDYEQGIREEENGAANQWNGETGRATITESVSMSRKAK